MIKLRSFINNTEEFPVLAGVAAGLYPFLFYFTTNLTLVNSLEHLGYFLAVFLIAPILLFKLTQLLVKRGVFGKWGRYALPFLNIFVFLFFIGICHYGGINKKASLLLLFVALVISYFLVKHAKKIIAIQLILALIGIPAFIYALVNQPFYSKKWLSQPDDIENVVFKKKPNVYFIQPDGYVNFSELKKGHYGIENSDFEEFLNDLDFKSYPNFRSNYPSTLASNSSILMMKHHYYNDQRHPSVGLHAREVIVSKNTVLDIFKNNGYRTHLITESPYVLLSRPKMGFDQCNFKPSEIPFIGKGFENKKNVTSSLNKFIKANSEEVPKFYFIEFFSPGHIANGKKKSKGIQGEKNDWMESLDSADKTLTEMITTINTLDPDGLIMILSDHGGYVGLEYAMQMYAPIRDRDIMYSIFGSNLSIRWPKNEVPNFDNELKSSVNVFRVLFSYLSDDEKYLSNLQKNSSYLLILNDAPEGTYECIDEEGKLTFTKRNGNKSENK